MQIQELGVKIQIEIFDFIILFLYSEIFVTFLVE